MKPHIRKMEGAWYCCLQTNDGWHHTAARGESPAQAYAFWAQWNGLTEMRGSIE